MNNRQKNSQAVIAARRQRVASLRLRGLHSREIQIALTDPARGMLNPETGKPWSLRTINYDLAALQKQWLATAARDIAEHQARQLAELEEHRRSAWSQKELAEVRLGLALEMKLLGTPEPERYEVLSRAEIAIEFKDDLDRAYGEDDEHTEDAEGGADE